jgi:pimeloyl-ACP methyl ester carboxylesterase
VIFPLLTTGVFLLPTLLLATLIALLLLALQRPTRRFWRAVLWLHLVLLPLHLFVSFPLALGALGSRGIGTRGDETRYAGPRLLADGSLAVQTRETLQAEREAGKPSVSAAVAEAAAARAVKVASSDGVTLRVFRIEAAVEPPRAVAVMVHGLFRSALELEPPAAMLRNAGCECWLVEVRNHGGSSRAPATFGLRESDDVVAAVQHVRSQPGRADLPLVVFGVSLGTAAVSLALPRLPAVAGVVLDAPMEDLLAAGQRMLDFHRPNDRRNFFRVVEPWRSATFACLEWWSGFHLADVQPLRVLQTLPADLPMLIVGGGDDDRMPPDTVQALYDALPMAAGTKELWIRPGSGHGRVWLDEPVSYEQHLRALLHRLRAP